MGDLRGEFCPEGGDTAVYVKNVELSHLTTPDLAGDHCSMCIIVYILSVYVLNVAC